MEDEPISVAEVAEMAKKNMKKEVWDYYECGSDDQITLWDNAQAFNQLKILPRVLRDVSNVDTSVKVLGKTYPVPFGIAPSAMHKLAGGDGELDVSRAAAKLGINMTLSSQSTTSLEDVMSTRSGQEGLVPEFWLQLYVTADANKSLPLIQRAEAAGYQALVVTVDTPVLGNRFNERKTPLALPRGMCLANIEDPNNLPKERKPTANRRLMNARTHDEAAHIIAEAAGTIHSPSLTWDDTLPFLRNATPMKIILKGILTPEDAILAVQHGADAIIVSNHGGRQLDSAPSTLEALPAITKAVKGQIPIFFDGGVRRGSDIFKALALGADFVLIGRPALYGLGYKGQEGVETVLNILERELSRTMALAGVTAVEWIDRGYLGVARSGDGFGIVRLQD